MENIVQKIMQPIWQKTKNKFTKICNEPGITNHATHKMFVVYKSTTAELLRLEDARNVAGGFYESDKNWDFETEYHLKFSTFSF